MPFERRARTGLPCAAVLGLLACDKPALTGRTGLETNCPRGYSLDRSRSELVVTNASISGVEETTWQGPLCDACYKAMLEARHTGGARGQGSGAPVRTYGGAESPGVDASAVRRARGVVHPPAPAPAHARRAGGCAPTRTKPPRPSPNRSLGPSSLTVRPLSLAPLPPLLRFRPQTAPDASSSPAAAPPPTAAAPPLADQTPAAPPGGAPSPPAASPGAPPLALALSPAKQREAELKAKLEALGATLGSGQTT